MKSTLKNKDGCIEKAVQYLRDYIIKYKSNLPELSLPPRVEDLRNNSMNIPESLTNFYSTLMQVAQSNSNDNIHRMIHSYASDMIHGVTRDRVMTEKTCF